MRPNRNNTTPAIGPNFPNLNRRKPQRAAHLVGAAFNLKHVAFFGGRDERGVDVRRNTRFLTAMGRDCQTAGPVGQTCGHDSVQGTFGIEMAGFYSEPGGEDAFRCGD